jgi:hypothetical protein
MAAEQDPGEDDPSGRGDERRQRLLERWQLVRSGLGVTSGVATLVGQHGGTAPQVVDVAARCLMVTGDVVVYGLVRASKHHR